MRRYVLPTLLALFLVPLIAGAQTLKLIPCVGGDACRACDLVQLAQNVMEFGFVVFVPIIFILVIVSAGFKMITSGQGSGLLKAAAVDIVTGLIIALCAWLVIDTGLKLLIKDPSFGPWNNVQCVENPKPTTPGGWTPVGTGEGGRGNITPSGGQCSVTPSGPCSVTSLQSQGGSWASESTASAMSKVCLRESGGDPNVPAGTDRLWGSGDGFSYGLFQINLTAHQLSCGGQTLNCASAFEIVPEYAHCRGSASDPANCWRQENWGKANAALGFGKRIVNYDLYNRCVTAAKNVSCNLAHAQRIYNTSGLQPWTTTRNVCGL